MLSRLNKDNYIEWLKNKPESQKVSKPVKFMKNEYYISENFLLMNGTIYSPIFDFERNSTFVCKDEKLMRYPNGTVILY